MDDEDLEEDDGDEWQFLSNDEEEEPSDSEEQIVRFFSGEDYQSLLCKCISALDLKGPPTAESAQAPDPDMDPQNIIKGRGDTFLAQSNNPKVFPLPIFFERQLKAEWKKPAMNKQCPSAVKCLYKLPEFTNDFLATPLVDAPVLDLQSSGLLSEGGQARSATHGIKR